MLNTQQVKQAARYRRAIFDARTKVDLLRKATYAVSSGRSGMHCTMVDDATIDAVAELGWSISVGIHHSYISFNKGEDTTLVTSNVGDFHHWSAD